MKRDNYINWNNYFMGLARLTAQRSKDPSTQVGSIITNDNKVIGMGYNGFPNGCDDDHFSWDRPDKYFYVVHSELNAVLNSNNFDRLKGGVLYTTLFPCNECVKTLIQVGIKKIIYESDKYSDKDEFIKAKEMLDYVKIEYEKYEE